MRWSSLFTRPESGKRFGLRRFVRQAALVAGVLVLVSAAYYAGLSRGPAGLSGGSQEGVTLYAEALNLVQDEYVDQEALDPDEQARAAIRGMLDSLGDKGHTRLLTPDESERNEESISGRYVGVGIRIEDRDGEAVVTSPIDGSPAAEAGVESGDVVVAVDGENVEGLELSGVSERIRGEEGTEVGITLRRDGEERSVSLERSEIDVSAASWSLLPGTQTAHVRLSSFSSESAGELETALSEARAAGAERFVLDLRNNPGGQLEQAVESAGLFLESGSVVYIRQDAEGDREKVRVSGGDAAIEADTPMTVLVNGGTASSAEILAGALRDNGRARLVGATTFGTGTVLQPYKLDDGSELLIGIAEWLTPDGDFIRDNGIQPGVKVKLGEDEEPVYPNDEDGLSLEEILSRDAQLERAVELLGGR
ncbi:S41 family peptidase [Rubrobacter aplysinae]|uniref:S41 family peptidase n=1 Tax=Rubrobacter aplysinae TaxID=909625 RepID=UPI00069EEBBA|nr:S41 family peptidase [Rubrobacter aplysinae]